MTDVKKLKGLDQAIMYGSALDKVILISVHKHVCKKFIR